MRGSRPTASTPPDAASAPTSSLPVLQVRDRLTGVRTEIEQLAGQQATLQNQATLATIHVSLYQ